jgi:hypothetical protein
MDRLDPDARMLAHWRLRGLDLNKALDDLHAAGVIAIDRRQLLAKMRDPGTHWLGSDEPIDPSDPEELFEALSSAGLVTAFNADPEEEPCRHDRLIFEFAEGSAGRFQPDAAVQARNTKGKAGTPGAYTVRFLVDRRLFGFEAAYQRRLYDVAAVHRALNGALEATGRAERFLALRPQGGDVSFVFADPKAFLPIAARYSLAVSADPERTARPSN